MGLPLRVVVPLAPLLASYLDARRDEMQAGMRELLSTLDGSRAARITMLPGMTRDELDSVGGVEEDA